MDVIDLLWGVVFFVVSLLVFVGAEMVKVSNYLGAKWCGWVSALSLLGIDVMWTIYSNSPPIPRIAISAIVGAIAFVGLGEALRLIARAESRIAGVDGGIGANRRATTTRTKTGASTGQAGQQGVAVADIVAGPVAQVPTKTNAADIHNKPAMAPPLRSPSLTHQPTSIYAPNSPGSIIGPSGGQNSITNNFSVDTPQRKMDDSLRAAILNEVPKNKPARVLYLANDTESKTYASEIDTFLRSNGYKMAGEMNWHMFGDVKPFQVNINLHADNDSEVWLVVGAYR